MTIHLKSRRHLCDHLDLLAKDCAEIGVFKGRFSHIILSFRPASLLLVDPWGHQDEKIYPEMSLNVPNDQFELIYQNLLQKYANNHRVSFIRDLSAGAAKQIGPRSLDFVYIDANHSYETCWEDLHLWMNKVRINGWLAGHDLQCGPVSRALLDFLEEMGRGKSLEGLDITTEIDESKGASWAIQKR